jgi:hypothetical protein
MLEIIIGIMHVPNFIYDEYFKNEIYLIFLKEQIQFISLIKSVQYKEELN